jgi:hypothetical protein
MFHAGRPLAPFPSPDDVRVVSDAVVRFYPDAAGARHWIEVGYRNGHLDGWHEGFRAASGMEAPSGGETAQQGSTEGDSPVGEAETPKQGRP